MKSNMKSVRMTDEVFETINEYRGNGFNEKLANLVTDFIHGRERMEIDAQRLQAYIGDKRDEQRAVVQRCQRMREVEPRLTALVNSVVALLEVK